VGKNRGKGEEKKKKEKKEGAERTSLVPKHPSPHRHECLHHSQYQVNEVPIGVGVGARTRKGRGEKEEKGGERREVSIVARSRVTYTDSVIVALLL